MLLLIGCFGAKAFPELLKILLYFISSPSTRQWFFRWH